MAYEGFHETKILNGFRQRNLYSSHKMANLDLERKKASVVSQGLESVERREGMRSLCTVVYMEILEKFHRLCERNHN